MNWMIQIEAQVDSDLQVSKKRYSDTFVPQHGTKNGYDWHRRGPIETPCTPCRDAMKAWWVRERIIKIRNKGKRAREYGAKHIPYELNEVLNTYGTNCHICQEPIDMNAPRRVGLDGWEQGLHLDHLIPLSKGGEDTIENIRPTHGQCNLIKHTTILEQK